MQIKTQVKAITIDTRLITLEYARTAAQTDGRMEKTDWSREREKMKDMLLPFIKEAVKKQFKEEREYYKTRPSLAAKQLENIFGSGQLENTLIPTVTCQVYEQIEERMRHEWTRKGRW